MVDKRQTRSVLPLILSVFNFDPRIRYHAEDNMLLTFLLPPKMKTKSAHKFYALLEDELATLYYTGIAGGKLKGALLMIRADQKGKEFDLGLRVCTSYDASSELWKVSHASNSALSRIRGTLRFIVGRLDVY